MDGWIELWAWVYKIGLGAFYLTAIVIIPLGARDMWRMFRELSEQNDSE
ncbi:MAG: hypothetical protein GXP28_05150 [Planctomycetes bacterium]|nr:hypothetical protein [Planctomycetota bacterium]